MTSPPAVPVRLHAWQAAMLPPACSGPASWRRDSFSAADPEQEAWPAPPFIEPHGNVRPPEEERSTIADVGKCVIRAHCGASVPLRPIASVGTGTLDKPDLAPRWQHGRNFERPCQPGRDLMPRGERPSGRRCAGRNRRGVPGSGGHPRRPGPAAARVFRCAATGLDRGADGDPPGDRHSTEVLHEAADHNGGHSLRTDRRHLRPSAPGTTPFAAVPAMGPLDVSSLLANDSLAMIAFASQTPGKGTRCDGSGRQGALPAEHADRGHHLHRLLRPRGVNEEREEEIDRT